MTVGFILYFSIFESSNGIPPEPLHSFKTEETESEHAIIWMKTSGNSEQIPKIMNSYRSNNSREEAPGTSKAKRKKNKARAINPSITFVIKSNTKNPATTSVAPQPKERREKRQATSSIAVEPPILAPRPIRIRRSTNRLGEPTTDESNISIAHDDEPDYPYGLRVYQRLIFDSNKEKTNCLIIIFYCYRSNQVNLVM